MKMKRVGREWKREMRGFVGCGGRCDASEKKKRIEIMILN